MQTSSPAAPKEALRAIRVFFYTMISGMLMFTFIIAALNFLQEPPLTGKTEGNIFLIAVLVVSAVCISVAQRIYSKRITEIQNSGFSLMGKLEAYRAALIFYMALCEGGGLFAVIVYFLTGNKWLLVVIAVVLLCMLLRRPEKFKIFNELQLSSGEQSELN